MGRRELTVFTCNGVVRDRSGAGVAGAAVMVVAGSAPTPEIVIVTRADGSFRVGLPRGQFTLEALAGDGRRTRRDVVIADAAIPIVLVLE